MAESTLALGYPDFVAKVGWYLGYGRDSSVWDQEQQDIVDECINDGLRQFLTPPALKVNEPIHEWSFLKVPDTLVTVADTDDYDADDDFGGVEGPLTFEPDKGWHPIQVVGENEIRKRRQIGNVTGRPQIVAYRPKAGTGTTGQRYEWLVWPTPNDAYTLTFLKLVLVDKITTASPYPLGGAAHAQTVLASMLAVAELKKNDQAGTKHNDWMSKLRSSVDVDGRRGRPELFGYNRDNSDLFGRVELSRTSRVLYDGTYYDNT